MLTSEDGEIELLYYDGIRMLENVDDSEVIDRVVILLAIRRRTSLPVHAETLDELYKQGYVSMNSRRESTALLSSASGVGVAYHANLTEKGDYLVDFLLQDERVEGIDRGIFSFKRNL